MTLRRRFARTAAIAAVAAATLVACTESHSPKRTPAPTGSTPAAGRSVNVLGLWSGPEFDSFASVKAAWEQQTGNSVHWQGSENPAADLTARIEAGRPPDIAVLPNVALLHQL